MLPITASPKIKILFIGFSLIETTISSVFRDRSEIIKRLNPNIFDKYLIYNYENADNIHDPVYRKLYNNLIASINHTIDCRTFSYKIIKSLVLERFDIVVYPAIGMHVLSTLFSHQRLAPIQINTWGHSVTSGVDTIDYYISSELYELEDVKEAQQHYSEKLILHKSLSTCYIEFVSKQWINKEELNLPKDKKILFCIQNTKKLNMRFYQIIRTILELVPNTVILLQSINNNERRNHITTLLLNRVIFINRCDFRIFNSYIYNCDLVLDPHPFGGCNSSLEAFSKGKIVITLPSIYLAGRFTLGFYKRMGILDAVANDYSSFVSKAVYYLENVREKEILENRIMKCKNMLFNDSRSVNEWENTLIGLYQSNVKNVDLFSQGWIGTTRYSFNKNLSNRTGKCNKILEFTENSDSTAWFKNNLLDHMLSTIISVNSKVNIHLFKRTYLSKIDKYNIIYITDEFIDNELIQLCWKSLVVGGLLIIECNYPIKLDNMRIIQEDFLKIVKKLSPVVTNIKDEIISLMTDIIPINSPIAHVYYEESLNFGDAAIWLGQEELLRIMNITPVYTCSDKTYNSIDIKKKIGDDGTILFRGGGNFGDLYVYHELRLNVMNDNRDCTFIQFPQSVCFKNTQNIGKTADIIKKVKRVILLARDCVTYTFFWENFNFPNVEIYSCCDMAFVLDKSILASPNISKLFDTLILKRSDKEAKVSFQDTIKHVIGNDIKIYKLPLYYNNEILFETLIYSNPTKKIAVTDWYFTEIKNQMLYDSLDNSTKAHYGLVHAKTILSLSNCVWTDRLHAFIFCLQLSIPHCIIDNTYGKIYEFYNTWFMKSEITILKKNFDYTMIQNQISCATEYDRYPEIFGEIKTLTAKIKSGVKILSFGCSTGDEVRTLNDKYFCGCKIDGLDLNLKIIEEQCKLNINPNVCYYSDISDVIKDSYDIIFCMSVLCRWPDNSDQYTFQLFEETLSTIDQYLNNTGLLVIYNSKYLFTDTLLSQKYKAIETTYKYSGFVTKYTKDNKVVNDYPYFGFRKVGS